MKKETKGTKINSENSRYKNRGITLIALVVTIIVLLILAGVTISLLTGDNGILTNSKTAKADTLKNQAIETINIALNSIKLEVLQQKNSDATYNPNEHATTNATDGLMRDSITGLKNPTNSTPGTATGYYINYADSKIAIAYVNTNSDINVSGDIDFTSYANGGTVHNATEGDSSSSVGSSLDFPRSDGVHSDWVVQSAGISLGTYQNREFFKTSDAPAIKCCLRNTPYAWYERSVPCGIDQRKCLVQCY